MKALKLMLSLMPLLALLLGGCADCNPYAAYDDCYGYAPGSCAPCAHGCPQRTDEEQKRSLFYWSGSR